MSAWKKYRCTMMLDGWTDRKSRSLINFLVNSPGRVFFYKSIDASESIKTGAFLCEQLDKVVAKIDEEHVIQVIIDNHISYVNDGARLMDTKEMSLLDSLRDSLHLLDGCRHMQDEDSHRDS